MSALRWVAPRLVSRWRPAVPLLAFLAWYTLSWPSIGGCSGTRCSTPSSAVVPESMTRHDLSGEARWYGERHHGRTTASGEPFDMHDLTAAHPSLPFGTLVRVIRLDTRQSVVVRINDRGPDGERTLIDLSRRAAEEIELIGPGHAPVEIEILQLPGPD